MTNQITIPFTYRISWSKLDKHYYGVKYAQGCKPSDLWKTYFTSSKLVEQYIKEYGDPDIIEVRKTFTNALDAQLWEKNVLMKLDVVHNDKWLNQVISGLWDLTPDQRSKLVSESQLKYYENACEHDITKRNANISKGRLRYIANRTKEQKQRDYEARLVAASKSGEAISKAAKERWNDPIWVENETKRRQETGHLDNFLSAAQSQETKDKIKATQQTDEYKEKHRQITTERWKCDIHRKKVSDTMKDHCSDPKVRKQMSDNAKKSTGNRLATRYLNQIHDKDMTNSIDDIVIFISSQITHEFDLDRLINKIKKRKKSLGIN